MMDYDYLSQVEKQKPIVCILIEYRLLQLSGLRGIYIISSNIITGNDCSEISNLTTFVLLFFMQGIMQIFCLNPDKAPFSVP